MDIIDVGAARKKAAEYTDEKISQLPAPFKPKEPVQTFADLPATGNSPGDVRKVIQEDNKEYYWSGSAWEAFGPDNPKENLFRFTTMPAASADNLGQIVQYIGVSTADYVKGYFYQCVVEDDVYSWEQINVQPEQDISGKADKVQEATEGNFVALDEDGNITDSGKKPEDFVEAEEDGVILAKKITAQDTSLGNIKTYLDSINALGKHVLFDVAALGANAYLCTIFIDSETTICKVNDLVKLRTYTVDYNASTLLSAVLANAYDVATHNEIENLQKEINRLVGGDVGDELIIDKVSSLIVTSSSGDLTFTVTDEHKFAIAVGECANAEYLLVYNGTAWTYHDAPVSDFGITVTGTPSTGEVMHVKMTCAETSLTVTHLHEGAELGTNETHPVGSTEDFFILEETYTPDQNVFDSSESALCITPGHTLEAGKYYVYNVAAATGDYWCNYKRLYYCFEVPHDIVATEQTGDIYLPFYQRGDRETTGDARGVYILRCKPTVFNTGNVYNSDVIEFVGQIAAPGEEYTDIRTLEDFTTDQSMTSEGIIYNNLGHVCYGNGDFALSNAYQRLVSAEKSMNPVRLHKNDVVTSLKNARGMQWGLDPRFLAAVEMAEYSMQYGVSDDHTKGAIHTNQSKCFLLSMKEMSMNIQTNEGVVTDLYDIYTGGTLTNSAVAARAKGNSKGVAPASYRWSRSADAGHSHSAYRVAPTGANGSNSAYITNRLARAYIILKSKFGNLGSVASD